MDPISAAAALYEAINTQTATYKQVADAKARLLAAESVLRSLGNDAQAREAHEKAVALAPEGTSVEAFPPVDSSVAQARVNGSRKLLEDAQLALTRATGRVTGGRVLLAKALQADAVRRYEAAAARLVADFADLLELTDRVGMPLFAAPARILIPAAEGMSTAAGPGLYINWDTMQASGVGLAAKARIDAEMQRLLGLVEQSSSPQAA